MSFRVIQSWPRRAVFAGALATVLLAFGVMPPPAAAQYVYDNGYIYTGPAYSYPPQSYPAYPSYPSYGQRYYVGGDWARAAIGRTALERRGTGVAVIGVTVAKVAGRIVAGQMKIVADRAAAARAAVAKAVVPVGAVALPIADLAPTAVIGDRR